MLLHDPVYGKVTVKRGKKIRSRSKMRIRLQVYLRFGIDPSSADPPAYGYSSRRPTIRGRVRVRVGVRVTGVVDLLVPCQAREAHEYFVEIRQGVGFGHLKERVRFRVP